ncbi:MAG TPA: hypothetical protein VGM92_08955 [Candidatus Kapabacteria bacterium]
MASNTENFDLAIGWLWEFDEGFVLALEREAQTHRKLSTFQIHTFNIEEILDRVRKKELHFRLFLDRGFDIDPRFEQLGKLIVRHGGAVVNSYDRTIEAIDKATMHLQFITAGLYVPFTIIISPYAHRKEVELSIADLAHLGRPFIIKPANTTGGGIGVVMGAETLADIIEARKEFGEDKYLLQERIDPREIEGRRCWFRCFFVFDKVFLAWWDDRTHIYQPVTSDEEHYYKLRPLRMIMRTIANISGLHFFSSEIALRQATPYEQSRFIVIDYVNDMCDMRSQLHATDGIAMPLWNGIISRLALQAKKSKP